jgi:ribose 5-phosphate isomerase B
MKKQKIFVGGDHAGFFVKEKLKKILEKNYEVFDVGPFKFDHDDDYPKYAIPVAQNVAKTKDSLGILICGSGIGVSIAANKVKGIRAAPILDVKSAKLAKEHGNNNVLCLSARETSFEKNKKILLTWLKTPFSNKPRHVRRLKEIVKFENKNWLGK